MGNVPVYDIKTMIDIMNDLGHSLSRLVSRYGYNDDGTVKDWDVFVEARAVLQRWDTFGLVDMFEKAGLFKLEGGLPPDQLASFRKAWRDNITGTKKKVKNKSKSKSFKLGSGANNNAHDLRR